MTEPPVCPIGGDPMCRWFEVPADWRRPDADERFDLWWCERCRYGMLYPRPETSDLGRFYDVASYFTHTEPPEDADQRSHLARLEERIRVHLAWRADRASFTRDIARDVLAGRPKRVCELGCGKGEMLEALCEADHTCLGVEIDQVARETARQSRNLVVLAGTAEDLPTDLDGQIFDAVVMIHVLEHCMDVNRALESVAGLLKPGGLFLCEVPNNEAEGLRRFGAAWRWLDVPRHLNFFTASSLRGLAERHGFTATDIQFTGYGRQFHDEWVQEEANIYDILRRNNATFTGLPRRPSRHQSWRLLARTVVARPERKYDSVFLVASKR